MVVIASSSARHCLSLSLSLREDDKYCLKNDEEGFQLVKHWKEYIVKCYMSVSDANDSYEEDLFEKKTRLWC